MALITTRRCTACSTQYDVLTQRGVTLGLDRDDDRPVCPKCETTEFVSVIKAGRGVDLPTSYPYFDRGLGCLVESAAHRKRICKERGIIPLDGADPGFDRTTDDDREAERLEAGYDEYVQHLKDHPDFREFREMEDRGVWRDRWKTAR